jgi:hypothetical protein
MYVFLMSLWLILILILSRPVNCLHSFLFCSFIAGALCIPCFMHLLPRAIQKEIRHMPPATLQGIVMMNCVYDTGVKATMHQKITSSSLSFSKSELVGALLSSNSAALASASVIAFSASAAWASRFFFPCTFFNLRLS